MDAFYKYWGRVQVKIVIVIYGLMMVSDCFVQAEVDFDGVASGAILSDYQRVRVEHVYVINCLLSLVLNSNQFMYFVFHCITQLVSNDGIACLNL